MLAYGIALLTLQAMNIKIQIESWPNIKADVLGAENRSLLNMIRNPAHGLRPDGQPNLIETLHWLRKHTLRAKPCTGPPSQVEASSLKTNS